jgi:hypothetical protein
MPRIKRLLPLVVAASALISALAATGALASSDQEALFQDGLNVRTDPVNTLGTLHALGVTRLRLLIAWNSVAPATNSHHKPRHFNASTPGEYPAAAWAQYDQAIRVAQADGIAVDLNVTGPAPLWATGAGVPRGGAAGPWRPSSREFNAFVNAVGTRYSGHYHGLPKVSFWSIWNEPNYGVSLAPQATHNDTIEVGAWTYRNLLDAAWSGLRSSGHGRDTILIGETAPRGLDHPIGNYSGVKPLRFLRAVYCVDSRYRELRGSAARARGCPTTPGGSRAFRSQHPGLFSASGFSDHPYAQGFSPVTSTYACGRGNRSVCGSRNRSDPEYADFAVLPRLERTLDRLNRVYGSHTRFPIWSTEYGYWSKPPDKNATINPDTAAAYMNWAEYLSYRQSRIRSYAQYLLVDPVGGNFASGLEFNNRTHKATYDAYRLPVFLPHTTGHRTRALEVWGCVRPAHFAGGQQVAQVQYRAGSRGSWRTVQSIAIKNRRGYFDTHVTFPGSGSVRLAWSDPLNGTVHSRTVKISLR